VSDSGRLTPLEFVTRSSESELGFTYEPREKIKSRYEKSKFESGVVRTQRKAWFDRVVAGIEARQYSDLCQTMISVGCKKPTAHNYTQFYDQILRPYRAYVLRFLELGIETNNADVPTHMNVKGFTSIARTLPRSP